MVLTFSMVIWLVVISVISNIIFLALGYSMKKTYAKPSIIERVVEKVKDVADKPVPDEEEFSVFD